MLIIRDAQMAVFRAPQHQRFIDAMCKHLRDTFPEEMAPFDDNTLKLKVSQTLKRAAGYGLTSKQDSCRYLNLAATYGWEFDQNPQQQWMHHYLTDPQVTSTSERLNLLVDQCIYRIDVQARNRQLRETFGLTETEPTHDTEDDVQASDVGETSGAPFLAEKEVSSPNVAAAANGVIEPQATETEDTPWHDDDALTVPTKESAP